MKKLVLLASLCVLGVALTVTAGAGARAQAERIQIVAGMNAGEERPVPRGEVANARGTFTATLAKSDAGGVLTWQLEFSGLTGPAIAAHIHIAQRGQPGPVVVPLCAPCSSGASGTANVNPTVIAAIQDDRTYVNVHTSLNGPGEIRGQVTPRANVRTAANARQERPRPKGRVARARATFTATITKAGSDGTIAWRLTFSRLTGRAVAAHIHSGARGRPGPVLVPLCSPCRSGVRGTANVSAAVLSALESGRAYVNVHTRRNPAGEVRGQIAAVALTLT